MSDCAISESSGNVGIAFGIVTAAGLSTTLGAALAFVMPYSRSSKNLFLAACLALAGGVMIYVSFVEIFTVKTIGEFAKCVDEEYVYFTIPKEKSSISFSHFSIEKQKKKSKEKTGNGLRLKTYVPDADCSSCFMQICLSLWHSMFLRGYFDNCYF